MTEEYLSVWDQCLDTIKKNVNTQSFKTWFEPIKPIQLNNGALTIQVPNKFFYEWLEEHYVALLKMTIKTALGDKGKLEYQIPTQKRELVHASREAAKTKTEYNKESNHIVDTENIKNPFVIPGIRRLKIDPQLNPNYVFDTFIEGDCNKLARNAGLAIGKKPGGNSFNPLFVFGSVGLGKTHLIQAIGAEVVKNFEDKNVLYVTSEKFTNQIVQAIKNNSINDFLNFYQLVDVLIIDDIQFLSGKTKTQEIFFHIFNQMHQSGKQLVFTSDRAPKDLEGIEDRIISRFKWGLSADLSKPDLETRMAILYAKAESENVVFPPEVIEFISYNIKDNIRELEGVIISLIAQSSLNKRTMDVNLAKDVIKNFIKEIHKEITVDFIKENVAVFFNIPLEHLKSKSRKRNLVIARQICMFIAKDMTEMSYKAIGQNFGDRDHSTVIYSCKTVQDLMVVDSKFKEDVTAVQHQINMSING
jgi:chromosomal replication initiator protein